MRGNVARGSSDNAEGTADGQIPDRQCDELTGGELPGHAYAGQKRDTPSVDGACLIDSMLPNSTTRPGRMLRCLKVVSISSRVPEPD